MSIETIIKTVLSFFPDAEGIYLFGTYLTPEEQQNSDVDVAVLLSPGKVASGSTAMRECGNALEEVLARTVDFVNLRTVNTVFQHEIIQEGRLLYQRREYDVDVFEMQVLSAYQKLNEERAGILEDIYESGRIVR